MTYLTIQSSPVSRGLDILPGCRKTGQMMTWTMTMNMRIDEILDCINRG